jgi:hypothetical protein
MGAEEEVECKGESGEIQISIIRKGFFLGRGCCSLRWFLVV